MVILHIPTYWSQPIKKRGDQGVQGLYTFIYIQVHAYTFLRLLHLPVSDKMLRLQTCHA